MAYSTFTICPDPCDTSPCVDPYCDGEDNPFCSKGEKGDPGRDGIDGIGEGCCPAHGNGSPEGVVTRPEGTAYVDDLTQDIYDKVIGEDAFGWVIRVVGGGGGAGNIFVVNSIAQARALPSLISNRILEVNGDMTGGDGVSHLRYTWDQASTAANNNGSVLQSTDLGLGRWIQN